MKDDLVCPECSSSISLASASMVASCTLCGADLDLSSAGPAEAELAPAGKDRGTEVRRLGAEAALG
jgi:hypothetical protein